MISIHSIRTASPLLQPSQPSSPPHPTKRHPYNTLKIVHKLETGKQQFPSPTTSQELALLLQSCIQSKSLQQGQILHSHIRRLGFEKNRDLLPKLIKLYCVCGRINDARTLFDKMPKRNLTVLVWTSLISGYIENGTPDDAIGLFLDMLEFGVRPDGFAFSALIKACAQLGFLELTIQLHSMANKCSLHCHLSVANSLINVYGSLGEFELAWRVFGEMPKRDVVSWTSVIRACSSSKKYAESIELFSRMQLSNSLKPNEVTIVSVLPACGFFSSLRKGQAIHAYIIRNQLSMNMIVAAALVSMYSQCGHPNAAFLVFNSLEERNVVLWTSMIEGYAMNGRFDSALKLFAEMQDDGLNPNYITLVVILSACGHGGLIDDGWKIFNSMRDKFGIEPQMEHYACVVDMLGRAGKLDEAEVFIKSMSLQPSGSMFGSLLGACQAYCNVELGERLAEKLFELEPNNAANYVMLSNVYAKAGRWDDVGRVRRSMAARGLLKNQGCSWIEIKDRVYTFGAHDKSHSESERIYEMLEKLREQIVKAGYIPSTEFVLLDVEEDDKKTLLCSHSERLAIAFGLMKAPHGAPIRIAKNLRVCGDCHDAIKLISKVISRDLIIRDTNRFHHFRQGSCSCGDYW